MGVDGRVFTDLTGKLLMGGTLNSVGVWPGSWELSRNLATRVAGATLMSVETGYLKFTRHELLWMYKSPH